MQEVVGAGVFGEFCEHAANDAEFVGVARKFRKEIANGQSRLATGPELPGGGQNFAHIVELGWIYLEQF